MSLAWTEEGRNAFQIKGEETISDSTSSNTRQQVDNTLHE